MGNQSPRPLQKQAIDAFARDGENVLLINGTGSGKSLVFQAYPFVYAADGDQLLVVAPMNCLCAHIHQRFLAIEGVEETEVLLLAGGVTDDEAMTLTSARTIPMTALQHARVLIATPDAVVSYVSHDASSDTPFEKYFRDANNRPHLKRIALDEVDQLILHWPFRPHCVQFIQWMRQQSLPTLVMTATITEIQREVVRWMIDGNLVEIIGPIARPEIQLQLRLIAGRHANSDVGIIREVMREWRSSSMMCEINCYCRRY